MIVGAGVARAQNPAPGQSDSSGVITGQLVDRENGRPIPYATVVVLETGRARFADDTGHFAIPRLPAGQYHVRGRQIGFAPVDTVVDLQPGTIPVPVTFRLRRLLIRLPAVAVIGHPVTWCVATGIPDSTADPELAAVFAQLRENVDRFRMLLEEYPFRYRRQERLVLHRSDGNNRTLQDDTVTYESRARRIYQPGHVLYYDRDVHGARKLYMFLPTFRDLEDSTFLRTHCFEYMGETGSGDTIAPRTLRIDFRPAAALRTPDVEGSVYLDATRLVIRRAVFRLTRPRDVDPPIWGLTILTTFREIVPLVPVLDSTHAQQPLTPIVAVDRPGSPIERLFTEDDQYLGHEFEFGAPGEGAGGLTSTPAPGPPPGTQPTVHAIPKFLAGDSGVRCPPRDPPADTLKLVVNAMVVTPLAQASGDPWSTHSDRVLAALARTIVLPEHVELPAFGYSQPAAGNSDGMSPSLEAPPSIEAAVSFTLDRGGAARDIHLVASSLAPSVDTTVIAAVQRASDTHTFPSFPSAVAVMGDRRLVVRIFTAAEQSTARGIPVARLVAPAWRLARPARLSMTVSQPSLAPEVPSGRPSLDSTTFSFVVDELGHPVASTVRNINPDGSLAPDNPFAALVLRSLSDFRFEPALIGQCAVKQLIRQRFVYREF